MQLKNSKLTIIFCFISAKHIWYCGLFPHLRLFILCKSPKKGKKIFHSNLAPCLHKITQPSIQEYTEIMIFMLRKYWSNIKVIIKIGELIVSNQSCII